MCLPFAFAVGGNIVFDIDVNVGVKVLLAAVVGVAVDVLVAFVVSGVCC